MAIVLLILITTTAEAAAKKKKTPNYASAIAKLKAQIAEAQSALNSVNQKLSPAKGKESEAKSRVQSIVSAMEGAQSSLRNAHDTLQEIEKHILATEDEAGEFAKSQKALDDVRQKLHAAQERILKSPEYLAKKQDAIESPNRSDLLADLRKKSLEDDAEYDAALDVFPDAKMKCESLRLELFKKNEDWVTSAKMVTETTAAYNELVDKLTGALLSEGAAKDAIRKFTPSASAAQATIAQDEAILKALQAKQQKKKK